MIYLQVKRGTYKFDNITVSNYLRPASLVAQCTYTGNASLFFTGIDMSVSGNSSIGFSTLFDDSFCRIQYESATTIHVVGIIVHQHHRH